MGIRGDHAKPLLVGEDLVAHLLPPHVELALELVDPLLLRLVRRVRAAGNVVEEEWLVRSSRIQIAHVPDGFVRHVGDEVVVGLSDPREDLRVIAE